jgi:hypothetical protein
MRIAGIFVEALFNKIRSVNRPKLAALRFARLLQAPWWRLYIRHSAETGKCRSSLQ